VKNYLPKLISTDLPFELYAKKNRRVHFKLCDRDENGKL
jgi:hypothetical protein